MKTFRFELLVAFMLLWCSNGYATFNAAHSWIEVISRYKINKNSFDEASVSKQKTTMVVATWVATTGNWDEPSNWSTGVVPDGMTDVLISGLARNVTIPANFNAVAMSVTVQTSSSLTLSGDATLSINGSAMDALTINQGATFTNSGILNIGNSAANGGNAVIINSSSSLVNLTSGTININNVPAVAFAMNLVSTMTNSGNINIGSTSAVNGAGFAMDNNCQLTNQAAGVIQINNIPAGDGFYLQLSNVINNGTIHIGNLSPILNRGISLELNSQFSNNMGATTTINRITSAASTEGIGIFMSSNSSVSNSGSLLIGNSNAVSNKGISMFFEASLSNSSTGIIEINNITNSDGISLTDDFTSITNSGTIRIGNTGTIQRMGIFLTSLASFTNNTSGVINIDNVNGVSASQGVAIYVNSGFTNNGNISIGTNFSLVQYGIYVQSPGNITNQSSGTIQINNVGNFDGISLTGSNAAMTNNGLINIGNLLVVKRIGISLFSSSNFTNNTTGTININNINSTTNGFGIYATGLSNFINKGPINIGNTSPIVNYGVYVDGGTLNNHSTGNLQINNITNLDGITGGSTGSTIINSGMIKIGNLNTVKRIGISLFNSSTLQNNGGSIEINTVTSTSSGQGFGIYMSSSSSFTNNALLNLGNIANISRYGMYILAPATFNNQSNGIINISKVNSFDGIVIENANAVFNNSGQLRLGVSGIVNRYGIFPLNGGQFNNLTGSLLEINNIPTGDGIVASGTGSSVSNQGTMNIGNIAGIYRFGLFLNAGTSMTNGITGSITINNILSTAANEGSAIRLSNATLTNSNSILIGNTGDISRFGMVLSSSAVITNQSAGNIQVNKVTTFYGITLQTSAKIFNNGILHIGNTNPVNSGGIGIFTASEFNNNAASTFTVNRVTSTLGDAIEIADASSKFINSGLVNIGNTNNIGRHGVNIYAGGLFQNNPAGNVQIKNITSNAIFVDGATSTFTNNGSLALLP